MANDNDVADIYSDRFSLTVSPYGVALAFALTPSTPTGAEAPAAAKVVVRMSLEHAKVMVMLLRKNLKQFESEVLGDTVKLPRSVLEGLQLDPDAW